VRERTGSAGNHLAMTTRTTNEWSQGRKGKENKLHTQEERKRHGGVTQKKKKTERKKTEGRRKGEGTRPR